MKLNIGSGGSVFDGYTNCDIRDIEGVQIVAPAWDLPFAGEEIEAIYSRHMIEHLTYAEARAALKEWARVLVVGGILEISCPDMLYCVRILRDPDDRNDVDPNMTNRQVAIGGLWGWQSFEHDIHKSGWDHESLAAEIRSAGFSEIMVPNRQDVMQPHLFRPRADVHFIVRK